MTTSFKASAIFDKHLKYLSFDDGLGTDSSQYTIIKTQDNLYYLWNSEGIVGRTKTWDPTPLAGDDLSEYKEDSYMPLDEIVEYALNIIDNKVEKQKQNETAKSTKN